MLHAVRDVPFKTDGGNRTIVEFKDRTAPKRPGKWYTYTYDNGICATLAEYQGTVSELEDYGRRLSSEKGREIRMRVHDGSGMDRIHAIFRMGKFYLRRTPKSCLEQ